MITKCIPHIMVIYVLSAGAVHADAAKGDGKTYSGLGCTEVPDGVIFPENLKPYGENDVAYNVAGWAFNSNTNNTITVACPIVREHTNKPMKRAWVTVFNQTKEDVLCQIEGYDSLGFFLEESTFYTFKPATKPFTVFKSNDKDDNDSGPSDNSSEWVPKLSNKDGYYMLICNLPAAEELVDINGPGSGVSYRMAYVIKYIIDEVSN